MKHLAYLIVTLVFLSASLTGCQTLGTGAGGSFRSSGDTVNDSSLYRSQDRTFRSLAR